MSDQNALLFNRRLRSEEEHPVYLVHGLVPPPGREPTGAHERDRARFLGRRGSAIHPEALARKDSWLSSTSGVTLDPIMCLGQEIELEPNKTARIAFVTLASSSRRKAMEMLNAYRDWSALDLAFHQSNLVSQLEMRKAGISSRDLEGMDKLLSALLYPSSTMRVEPSDLVENRAGQPGLWRFGISGDHPILSIRIRKKEELGLVRQILAAHRYWRNRNIKVDIVILYVEETSYTPELEKDLHRLLAKTGDDDWLNRRGGIFLVNAENASVGEMTLLLCASRAVLYGEKGPLEEQLKTRARAAALPRLVPIAAESEASPDPRIPRPSNLLFDNGIGGFTPDGREYVIYLSPGQSTPTPWINVIAYPEFGCLISESGSGSTWAINSGENRLTPWHNDPVADPPGEAVYLRDEITGVAWSPTPSPAGPHAPFLIRHGAGYTVFENHSHGLEQSMEVFVAVENPVKVLRVRLKNTWENVRRVTVTYYVEWTLGEARDDMQQYVLSEYDEESETLLARNPYNVEFGDRVAFVSSTQALHGMTTDRSEFLGRMGNYKNPAALDRIGLAGSVRPGADPCSAVQVHVDLGPLDVREVCFFMGQGSNRHEALEVVRKFKQPGQVEKERRRVAAFWDDLLGAVQVETPDKAMNLLFNRWLPYQNASCRLWGRSALYQSSGAYGFRDQLQDVMALVHTRPELARGHLLRAARHQFEEGDVLHWWHPPAGRGVRTRIADDLLWLPFATAYYVRSTGDESLLQEPIPFLSAPPLMAEEEERYGRYESQEKAFSLYEHCLRAIRKGSTAGPHGLPLFAAGDWNDGMNRVGREGKGESVWLGWFLYAVLTGFAEISGMVGDLENAARSRSQARELREMLEAHGWDGAWYLRGYYDDGSYLGSSMDQECRIDSVVQSWAVLSGAADSSRSDEAMKAVEELLVQPGDGLIRLLTPPFDRSPKDPGYIKGYPPGIRENGGQYTHAALWVIWALAQKGQGDRAERLFRMLNPVYHSDSLEKAMRYKVEPYVVAADVYSAPPHAGRGGWSWYTGSGGWMYRVGLEAILGLHRMGARLRFDPSIPKHWQEYSMTYRYKETEYRIRVENLDHVQNGVREISLDGKVSPGNEIPLADDGVEHFVVVRMASG